MVPHGLASARHLRHVPHTVPFSLQGGVPGQGSSSLLLQCLAFDIMSSWHLCLPFPKVCVCAQSCPTLCDPMDCSPPGSSVQRISQARILEWVAISFSRDIPDPGIKPKFLYLVGRSFTTELPGKPLHPCEPPLTARILVSNSTYVWVKWELPWEEDAFVKINVKLYIWSNRGGGCSNGSDQVRKVDKEGIPAEGKSQQSYRYP